ncbi:MAG: CDP-glycerol glycerophosphotransferase family protein [Acidobacteria bacterium]|nr:CDP-glycerol glycerophosphotransferase family protein [Acidobacteriota bacterium]
MKTLVVWGRGSATLARQKAREGARFVLWDANGEATLREAGVEHSRADPTPDEADRADEAAIAWTKAWGKRPVLDGRSVRNLLEWKGVSLWWLAELYLHHSTRGPGHVRAIEAFHRILDVERPAEVEPVGLEPEDGLLLGRACTARGVLFHGPRALPAWPYRWRTAATSFESRWNNVKTFVAAVKATLAGRPEPPDSDGRKVVLFLSHAAFWRERRDAGTDGPETYEHYFDRLIPSVASHGTLRPYVVAVGPRAAFRRRGLLARLGDWLRLRFEAGPYVHVNGFTSWRVFRETLRATREIREAWRRLRRSPGVQEAFSHRGVGFADLSGPDLAGTLLLQLPWAVRSYEEMAEVLSAARPAVACLYAESSGWGRAAVAACRAAGVPTVALQHGILYPKYYSYRHETDEAESPRPDRTALFGEAARRILVELGSYPPESLVLTGSPKFDALLRAAGRWDRAAVRQRLGVGEGESLLVVASRYRGIRETHQSIGSAFPALVRAVEALPGTRCVVKPHPAEPSGAYAADIRAAGARRVSVLPSGTDLLALLHAADGLVTVESLSAVEALVLDRPVLILNMPTNLREIVDHGAALGVPEGEDPRPVLEALLRDPATRERLAAARARYLSHVAQGVDGRATERILALLEETAARAGVVVS